MAKRIKKKAGGRVVASSVTGKVARAPKVAWLRQDRVWGLLLLLAVLVVYSPAMQGDFLWDDDTYISDNPCLRTWHGLWQIWFVPAASEQYYPLSFTVFWLEYHLWGLNTVGYHVVTVLLHGIASVLLWQVLAALRVRGALLAGAIFALHPVNVMSVAWMTELKNTLSGCLALGAGWAYIRFAGLGIYEKQYALSEAKKPTFYLLALVLFLLAMLAKTAVSFLPLSLLLILWWQKQPMRWRDILGLIPMVGISVGMGILTIYVEQHAGGASGADFHLGLMDRILVSGRSFWFYLGKLLFPFDLTFIYPRWHIDAGSWWQYLYPLAAFVLLLGIWMARGRLGKGVWVACMHFYMTTSMLILIVVLYMMRYSFVSDHWQYFGSMGILGLFAAGLTIGLDRLGLEGKPAGVVLKFGLLLILALLSWHQAWIYQSRETLWTDTLAKNPNCWMAHNNLGGDLAQKGQFDEAMIQYQKTLELNPKYADAYNNLGFALAGKGRVDEAITQYRKALAIAPDFAQAHYDLGLAFAQKGQLDDAMAQYQKALEIQPSYAAAYNNVGNVLLNRGQVSGAITEYQKALAINPNLAQTCYNLGTALAQEGHLDQAIIQFQRALEIDPGLTQVRTNLGIVLFQTGKVDEAIAQFQEVVRLHPDDGNAQSNLARAQAMKQAGAGPK